MSLWYKTIQERVGTCLIFWWFIKLMSRKHSSFYHAFVSLTISNQISRPAISIIWEHKCILQELCLKICFTKHPSIQNIIANDKLFGQISVSLQSMWPWRNVLRESRVGIIWSKHIPYHILPVSCYCHRSWYRTEPLTRASHAGTIKLHNWTPTLSLYLHMCAKKDNRNFFFLLSMTKCFWQNKTHQSHTKWTSHQTQRNVRFCRLSLKECWISKWVKLEYFFYWLHRKSLLTYE